MNKPILPEKSADYPVCFLKDCPLAMKCLRFISSQELTDDKPFIKIVNPSLQKDLTNGCPCYRPNEKVKVAYGISHIYDNVPYSKMKKIKLKIQGKLNKTTYYRIFRKERPLWPKDQQIFQEVFSSFDITEPVVFDECHEVINW